MAWSKLQQLNVFQHIGTTVIFSSFLNLKKVFSLIGFGFHSITLHHNNTPRYLMHLLHLIVD